MLLAPMILALGSLMTSTRPFVSGSKVPGFQLLLIAPTSKCAVPSTTRKTNADSAPQCACLKAAWSAFPSASK